MNIDKERQSISAPNNENGIFAFNQFPTLASKESGRKPPQAYVDVPPAEKKSRDNKKENMIKIIGLGAITAGFILLGIGGSTRDGAWNDQKEIRDMYPQGSYEFLTSLEAQENIPERLKEANILMLAGIAAVLGGVAPSLAATSKEK